MRAPYRTSVGQTKQPLAYLSDAGATPEAFGAGIGQALSNFGNTLGAQIKAREEKTDKFTTLRNFSEFETTVSSRLEELKRDADPSGKGFLDLANSEYDQLEQDFLTNEVPPELRDEFTFRAGQVKQGLVGNALDFQYKAGDAYFKQGIADELSKAQIALAEDPSQLESYRGRINEAIDATDLSDIEKEIVRKNAMIGLEGVPYRATVKEDIISSSTPEGQRNQYRQAISVIESGSAAGNYGALGKPTKRGDRAYGRYQVMGENIGPWTLKVLGRQLTPQEFLKDHGAQDAVFDYYFGRSVKKYGNPLDAASVWFTGGPRTSKTMAASDGATTGNQYVTKFASLLGKTNADEINARIDNDPRFANIPYEERLALRRDAEADANQEIAQQKAMATAQQNAYMNQLLQGIQDGKVGQSDLDNAYEAGQLFDYDDRMKAQNALDQKDKDIKYYRRGTEKLADDAAIWNPWDEDDKKSANAVVSERPEGGSSILDQVGAADPQVMLRNVVPMIGRMHDIPTDLAGVLTAMVRSNNQTNSLYALDAMKMIQDNDPRAFDQRFGEETAKDVALYRALRDTMPEDQIMGAINGGNTQEARQQTKMLREEAQSLLQTKEGGVTKLSTLVSAVVGEFDPGITSGDPNRSAWPAAARALDAEYQTLFVEGYGLTGDEEKANEYAVTALKKNWAVTQVDGANVLMKYPPEKLYRPVNGDHSWITENMRAELGLAEGERFQLISDETTANEWKKFQKGGTRLPSYPVVTFDANGIPRLKMKEVAGRMTNEPLRYVFAPTADQKMEEVIDTRRQQAVFDYNRFMVEWNRAEEHQFATGIAIPEELVEKKKRLDAFIEGKNDMIDAPVREDDEIADPKAGMEWMGSKSPRFYEGPRVPKRTKQDKVSPRGISRPN